MTEEEWLSATDPRRMLEFLRGKVSDRKLRLFGVVCCRSSFYGALCVYQDKDSLLLRQMLGVADRLCDRSVKAKDACAISAITGEPDDVLYSARWRAARACVDANAYKAACDCSAAGADEHSDDYGDEQTDESEQMMEMRSALDDAYYGELRKHASLLREIVGIPFRPINFDPAWQTSTVTSLAQATYNEREIPDRHLEPDRLAILADALEDAGCTDAAILEHLRGTGPHVRGCWVVDLLLGKT